MSIYAYKFEYIGRHRGNLESIGQSVDYDAAKPDIYGSYHFTLEAAKAELVNGKWCEDTLWGTWTANSMYVEYDGTWNVQYFRIARVLIEGSVDDAETRVLGRRRGSKVATEANPEIVRKVRRRVTATELNELVNELEDGQ